MPLGRWDWDFPTRVHGSQHTGAGPNTTSPDVAMIFGLGRFSRARDRYIIFK